MSANYLLSRCSVSTLRAACLLAGSLLHGGQAIHAQADRSPTPLPRLTTATKANALPGRVPPAADFVTRVALPGHRPAWATIEADRGALPGSQRVPLIFALRRPTEAQAAFEQLLRDQQDRSSPRFHQWLTPQQVGEQFGPTQNDLNALTGWLKAQNFTVDSLEPSRIFVQVSAPAAVVEAALGTSIHRYANESETGLLQAPANNPTLPAALLPLVAYIDGLTSVPRHSFTRMQVVSTTLLPGGQRGSHPNLTTSAGNHYLTPADFATIYNLGPVYSAGIRGGGQRVMIVGGSRLNPADLNYWETDTTQSAYLPNYIVGPGFTDPGQTNDDDMGEGTLDFERAYGTAPGAAVDMVIAQNWLSGSVNTSLILYAINTVNDPVLSLSFGSCEAVQTASYVLYEDSIYAQASAQGISVFVASGDAGVTGCAEHGAGANPATQQVSINDICASSFVTCVGGTQFNDAAGGFWNTAQGYNTAISYIPEGAWNEPMSTSATGVSSFVVASSGGGASTVIPKPAWQIGAGVPADAARDTPDVSFSAALHDGYFGCLAYTGGGCVPTANGSFSFTALGGTSASAPSMAGVAALLNSRLGSRLGNLNPLLYSLAASSPAVFHDAQPASSGVANCTALTPSLCNNSTPGPASLTVGATAGYLLTPGYDLVTGLGSLNVGDLIPLVSSTPAIATTSTLTSSVTSLSTLQTVVFTASVAPAAGSATSAPTGSVTFLLNGVALGSPVVLRTGQASTAPISLPAGTGVVSAVYSGDSNFAGCTSNLLTLTVTAVPTATTLSASANSVPVSVPVTLVAAVSGIVPASPSSAVVTFRDGNATLGTATVSAAGAQPPVATLVLPANALSLGTHQISASFAGDSIYAPSASSSVTLTVTAAPSFNLAPASASLTLASARAASGADVIGISSGNAYAGTINFTCAVSTSGAVKVAPTCLVDASSVMFPQTTSTNVTIMTVAPHDRPIRSARTGTTPGLEGVIRLCCLFAIWLPLSMPLGPRDKRRRLRLVRLALFFLLTSGILALSGCGANTFTDALNGPALSGGTTAGNYTVTVTGTAASGSASASAIFSVTVN
jgi:hypothetical protein